MKQAISSRSPHYHVINFGVRLYTDAAAQRGADAFGQDTATDLPAKNIDHLWPRVPPGNADAETGTKLTEFIGPKHV